MSTDSILAIAISIPLTVFIMILIGGKEQAIRKWIGSRKNGWLRSIYIKIFVDVVRGREHAYRAKHSHAIWLLIGAVLFLSGYISHNYSEQSFSRIQIKLSQLENTGTELPDTEKQLSKDEVREELEELSSKAYSLVWISRFNYYFFGIFFVVVIVRHKTIVAFRAQFSFELDRFMNRIQALASKKELAELVTLEAKVDDEKTAKAYVEHVECIARRHNVDVLIENLLLWEKYSDSEMTSEDKIVD